MISKSDEAEASLVPETWVAVGWTTDLISMPPDSNPPVAAACWSLGTSATVPASFGGPPTNLPPIDCKLITPIIENTKTTTIIAMTISSVLLSDFFLAKPTTYKQYCCAPP